ncbi:MAG: phasin family protein [Cyclonatronaceae bacterium]
MSNIEKAEKKVEKAADNIADKAREIWLAGLGALSAVEEEGSKFYNNLVDKGTEFEKRGKKQVDTIYKDINDRFKDLEKRITDTFGKAEDKVEDNMAHLVKKMGVPSREEVKDLSSKVEKLMKKVDELSKKMEHSEKQPAKTGKTSK